jgi:FixJ family two-component response regulator
VLAVDADPASLETVRQALAGEGFAVQCVVTGDAARSALRAAPPAAVVLDLSLPDVPGLDLLRELRREHRELPILAMVAKATVADVVTAMKIGASDFLTKPLDAARLRRQVRDAVQQAVNAQEADRLREQAGGGLTELRIDDILQELVTKGGSDLHLKVGRPPLNRVSGDLVPTELPAVEVMINSPNIRELIAEGKTAQVEKAIAASGDYYRMRTFNQALARLVQAATITEEEATAVSSNPGDLRLLLKGYTSGSASATRPAEPSPYDTGKLKITRGY